MGIDGRNTLIIRGAEEVLNIIESTYLVLDEDKAISARFFGKENIEIVARQPKLIVIDYEFRNDTVYDYLKLLLTKYPTCWFKNTYITEIGCCGMWIGRFVGSIMKIQELEWTEPSGDEKFYLTDFSKIV